MGRSRPVRWGVVIECAGEQRMYGSESATLLELATRLDWMLRGGSARVVLVRAVCRPPTRRRRKPEVVK